MINLAERDIVQELERETVETALAPGNLFWGVGNVNRDLWLSLVNNGIRRAQDLRIKSFSPRDICFSMLPKLQSPEDRLDVANSFGYGPTEYHADRDITVEKIKKGASWFEIGSVAIIVSRKKLLAQYPDRVKAVGEFFAPLSDYSGVHEVNADENTVFGIPIEIPESPALEPLGNEVRILGPSSGELAPVTVDMWEGVVIKETQLPAIDYWLQESGHNLHIPVLSLKAELLSTNIG